jgi:hypothetical protein
MQVKEYRKRSGTDYAPEAEANDPAVAGIDIILQEPGATIAGVQDAANDHCVAGKSAARSLSGDRHDSKNNGEDTCLNRKPEKALLLFFIHQHSTLSPFRQTGILIFREQIGVDKNFLYTHSIYRYYAVFAYP